MTWDDENDLPEASGGFFWGGKPRLDDAEIDAIVAFLATLTDRDLPPPPI